MNYPQIVSPCMSPLPLKVGGNVPQLLWERRPCVLIDYMFKDVHVRVCTLLSSVDNVSYSCWSEDAGILRELCQVRQHYDRLEHLRPAYFCTSPVTILLFMRKSPWIVT